MFLTKNELMEWLEYNPENGKFVWLKSSNFKIKIGSEAGSIKANGYRCIRINYKYHQAHRLAWLYMTGEWPKQFIDHINCNRSDNSFVNLREATRSQNGFNRSYQNDNTLKVKGVHLHQNKYLAQIVINGKPKYLGLFKTLEEAKITYENAAKQIYGEFIYRRNEND